jgi:hypothetical protein
VNHLQNLSPLKRRRIRFQNQIYSNVKEAVTFPITSISHKYTVLDKSKESYHNRLPFSSYMNRELSRLYGVEMKRTSLATCIITYAVVSSLMNDDTEFACDVIKYGRDYEYITRVNDYLFGRVEKISRSSALMVTGFDIYGRVIRCISRIERGEKFPFSSTDMPWKSIPEAVTIMRDWRRIGREAATTKLIDTSWFSTICAKIAYHDYSLSTVKNTETKF